ncbi:MAG: SdpI family protein [Candidatus Paceibacterota bacterium]|jgi:uncharacterized membrane protein|nr:SdpI family protein [Candidatus Paceibacterota bacterium]
MTTKQTSWLITAITSLSLSIGWYFYPILPENIASHWGLDGNVNGYMSKIWGLFFVPVLMIFISLLLFWLPKIDPLKKNIELFRKQYNAVIAGIAVFLFYIHMLTIFWNTGYRFDMGKMIIPAIAILWFMLGAALPKMKQNWFMGIRTPWTLENERVWDETHKLAGKLFQYSAAFALFGLLFPPYSFLFLIIPIALSALTSVIYSYYLFKKYDTNKRE